MTSPAPTTQSIAIPAPVSGLNLRSPKDAMEPTDALILTNWWPRTQAVETRKGYREHSSGMGTRAVETLTEFVTTAGVNKLIAAANGHIYDATTLAGTATSLASGFTNNRWQTCSFNNRLILVNGEDAPQSYNGTAVSAAGFTGPSSVSDLVHVSSFKDRLYFLEKDSAKLWYGGPGAITGALESFPLEYYLTQGGYPLFTTQWSQATGDGQENQFVVVGSEGDVLIYTGSSPTFPWVISRRAVIPKPLGRRAYCRVGSDVIIATYGGIVRLADYMSGKAQGTSQLINDKLDKDFRELANTYKGNHGWDLKYYANEVMLVVNVPTVEGTSSTDPQSIQLAYNMQTGAPAKFSGINASAFAILDDSCYFGGTGGKVYEFYHGNNDNGSNIDTDLLTSFQYYGDRASFKRFLAIKPLLTATNDASVSFSLDTDFVEYKADDRIEIDVRKTPYGSPYGSPYSDPDALVNEFMSTTATGKNAALRLKTSSNTAQVTFTSLEMIYDTGGVM